MTTHDDPYARWYAFHLGELPEAERAEVEREMAADPAEAERIRRVCAGVEDWAGSRVPHVPLNVHRVLDEAGMTPAATPVRGWRRAAVSAWPWAAAAGFLIAISQISFSIQIGDSTLTWGQVAAPPSVEPSAEVLERLANVEAASNAMKETVDAAAVRTASFEEEVRDSVAELAYNQQIEAQARFADIERLLALTGLNGYSLAATFEP